MRHALPLRLGPRHRLAGLVTLATDQAVRGVPRSQQEVVVHAGAFVAAAERAGVAFDLDAWEEVAEGGGGEGWVGVPGG